MFTLVCLGNFFSRVLIRWHSIPFNVQYTMFETEA